MGLTEQQKLYGLPDYFLMYCYDTHEIIGIISEEMFDNLIEEELFKLFNEKHIALTKVNFNNWFDKGYSFLKSEGLICEK